MLLFFKGVTTVVMVARVKSMQPLDFFIPIIFAITNMLLFFGEDTKKYCSPKNKSRFFFVF